MTTRRLSEVLTAVCERPAANGLRLVAVDGPSASGKSTLASRLAALAQAPLLAVDDFLAWPDLSGWWPRFQEQVLEPLLRGNPARYQVRDWENDEFGTSLAGWKEQPWAPLIIVEGVTVGRRAAADAFAYRIWVEAPAEVRLARGIARDGESHRHLWLDWMRREHEFYASDQTREAADLLVDGAPLQGYDPAQEVILLDA